MKYELLEDDKDFCLTSSFLLCKIKNVNECKVFFLDEGSVPYESGESAREDEPNQLAVCFL
ncbi:hypothetical protein J45TS6_21610 [Paenibacillus sp. J45TS6]|nr:hypothetical protein J45TS6_21610 [Paenibacillus sp. J45TS6]